MKVCSQARIAGNRINGYIGCMELTQYNPVRTFKALSEETRLQMLILILQHGELCVCDLESVLEIGQSKASRHLRYLLNAGLLQDRREGVWIYYRIADTLDSPTKAIIENIDQLLDNTKIKQLNEKLLNWRKQMKCGLSRGKFNTKAARTERTS